MDLSIKTLATALLIIGGLNWGLVGATGKDLVGEIFGAKSTATRGIFILVGIAALVKLATMAGLYEGFATNAPTSQALAAKGAIGKAMAAATGTPTTGGVVA
jgi:uncharacterized membrane protein YuzA (DUF378 family)